jgi:hypothetical protein
MSEQSNTHANNSGGRKIKKNPSVHRYVFRLTAEENASFLSKFEASGVSNKAKFISSIVLNREIKTVKIDFTATEFHVRLTNFFGQFRAVGVNYNQIVKLLYHHFSEKKAAAYLYKLEKQTIELAMLCQKVVQLTQEFEVNHLNKNINDS